MATEKTEIQLLDNEYWWGGACRHGDQMPFTADSEYRVELGVNLWGNQGCPLLVSSKGRYVWSDDPFSFEFKGGVLTIDDALGEIVQSDGHDNLRGAYLAACAAHFPASGRTPNEQSFLAPQYNAWIDMLRNPTQEKVYKYAQEILDCGMPPGVFMIDDWWYRSNCTWRWDYEAFPEPQKMVDWLHEKGFQVMLWVSHFVTPDTRDYLDLRDKGWLLRERGQDEPLIRKWWNGYGALLDISHPEAYAWYQGQLDALVEEYGIDGFKFDGGDPWLFHGDLETHAPRNINEFCEDFGRLGLKYDLSEYRACWKLGGQHLLQRVRDKHSSWGENGMADLLPTTIAQGLVGYPYIAPDMVGGGEDTSFVAGFELDQENFVRWAQLSTFFPIIQYSMLPNRVLDEKHAKLVMEMVALRTKLGPKILEIAKHSAKTGEPMLRNMAYEFPAENMETVGDQYMLGSEFLVAPILTKGAESRVVRFPTGVWEGDDGSEVIGPCEQEISVPLSRLPWYTKIS